jgi:hypothetical protein
MHQTETMSQQTEEPTMNRPAKIAAVLSFTLAAAASSRAAHADDTPPVEPPPAEPALGHDVAPAPEIIGPVRAHGPDAPDGQFPSHVFQWEAHAPRRVQIGFDYGLSQPLLTHGFNAAIDVRYKRLVATYSHGQGLDYARFETDQEKTAGAAVKLPWTTGGGIGVLLIDELWILADFKVHHFLVDTAVDHLAYTTVTIGAELGWRYFIWKGFNVALVARYWPNVYSTSGKGVTLHDQSGTVFLDPPEKQGDSGFLANVLVGWAFNL